MKKVAVIAVLASTLGLAGCETGSKQGFGTVLGAISGAAIGNAIAGDSDGPGKGFAIAAGAIAGAAIGNNIGKSLDEADRIKMAQSRQVALERFPSGETVTWHNPDTGNSGTFVPQPAYQNEDGRYCREYQQTVTIGGRTEQAYGKACRQPDGSWEIV
ncbi:RT0821/Lpp0805 family surface protein [Luteithermobacter gelatinilyticus]|uniref:RT0821/Lpp0805 family surface protein n=1 Tax=Luteithermobacter gelatinilyticus TaxID=2582913 RepID=UPI001105EC67|nr:RT0821/Lpp0805 family surface protein [Luteithermobacter gelatinilyticus]|tara:strand:- start:6144 stop:6617 length:474 start_codon:yes stop_codon:yes gene_type:complete